MNNRHTRRSYIAALVGASSTFIGTETGSATSVEQLQSSQQPTVNCRQLRCSGDNNAVRTNGSGPSEAVEELWRFDTDGELYGQPILTDNTVYLADTNGNITAVERSSGNEKWSINVDSSIRATPVVTNGLIIVPAQDRLLALSPETGTGEWQLQSTSKPGPLTFDNSEEESAIYFVSRGNKNIRRVDVITGEEDWKIGLDDFNINTSLTLADGQLYSTEGVATGENENQAGHDEQILYLRSRSKNDGSIDWEHELASGYYGLEPELYVTYHDEYVYFVRKSNELVKMDANSGNIEWSVSLSNGVQTYPIYANSRIYVTIENNLVSIDPSLGTKRWSSSFSGRPTSPVYINKTLYFGSSDSNMYGYDAETGEQKWNFSIGGNIVAPPVVTNNRIYVANTNGSLFALGETEANPAGPDVTGDGNPAQDVDGDGLYEDVNGDGSFTIVDVQALFANLDSEAVQQNVDRFDFNNDGKVDVSDVQALYNKLQ